MTASEQLFVTLLRSQTVQDRLFVHLSNADIGAVRAASSACCNLVTKTLFTRIHVTFTAATFTKPSRVAALGRIGHHVEHLTFHVPHSHATFLPPLIHPLTGQEICFLYSPHTSMSSVMTRPKYANTELGEILTQQYPPLFHAATNVPSFIHALQMVPNMRHLTIYCPGQDPAERYRRSVVDYALISMRIAVERAPLTKLNKLSLSFLHPAAFTYLRHAQGFGCVPSAARRWRQIKKLQISVEAWDFYGPSPGLDLLKTMDDYIRYFAPTLEKFTFAWVGSKGPCPVALSADPLFAPPRSSKKLFHEVTSPMSPLPTRPSRSPIHFPVLRYLEIRKATMNAPQLSALINSHRETVKEFDFRNVVLINRGSWDEALAPLSGDRSWSRTSLVAASECTIVSDDSFDDLPSPSAAAAAASKELLDVDLGGLAISDEESEVIEAACESVAAAEDDDLSISTKLKKKRVRRRRHGRSHHDKDQDRRTSEPRPSMSSSSSSFRLRSPFRPRSKPSFESEPPPPPTPIPKSIITAPMLASDPRPVLLQPTVYNPSALSAPDEGISSVQRNIEREEAHRRLAEDAVARVRALQRAKEAVLSKLSREFCSKRNGGGGVSACRLVAGAQAGGGGGDGHGREVLMDDRGSLESRSTLVPLFFSRS
ncbi:hypothetical protein HRG_007018 [Hirsutella rhossiliensis]|uniref:Uncharacterized protein n=1 Tax=Hirsutella rhossiliensis TaxID=111463 RepID=A0A9P8SGE0_9HYPO|nr:uncharacterized protein HRG_07018 [Hirsutella rhossiliensis]KAH0961938.1 hypothetical protein HRG_07018 [Hirsutella rhossiliensis]